MLNRENCACGHGVWEHAARGCRSYVTLHDGGIIACACMRDESGRDHAAFAAGMSAVRASSSLVLSVRGLHGVTR